MRTIIISFIKNILFLVYPGYVQCNICGHKDFHMQSDSWHKHTVCLKCKSQVRHRLVHAALSLLPDTSAKKVLSNKVVLHFAPDEMLIPFLKTSSGKYTTADYFAEGYSYEGTHTHLDISDMKKEVESSSVDTIIALDVLEHVKEDKAAITESFRVLKPGGWCIYTIPQKDHLKETEEDKSVTDPKERERLYGQWDHLRIYGTDFKARLENAGFKVIVIDADSFSAFKRKKHVLFPPFLSDHPHATNFRKVYFSQKPV